MLTHVTTCYCLQKNCVCKPKSSTTINLKTTNSTPMAPTIKVVLGEGNGTPLQYSCLENPMDGGVWWAAVHGVAKSRTRLSDFTFTFHFHALEKKMATHSSVLAWRISGTGEPGGLPSMGSHRVGHDWSDLAAAACYSWEDDLKRNIVNSEMGWNCPLSVSRCLCSSAGYRSPVQCTVSWQQCTHSLLPFSSLRNERKARALCCRLLLMWSRGNTSAFRFLCFLFQLSRLSEFWVSFLRSCFQVCLKTVKAIPTNRHNFFFVVLLAKQPYSKLTPFLEKWIRRKCVLVII